MKDSVFERIVKQKTRSFEDYILEPFLVKIEAASTVVQLDNDILILVNDYLDIETTAKLVLQSQDNVFITSKTEYDGFETYKYQSFTGNLEVTISNYGASLTGFNLEFIKIVPLEKKKPWEADEGSRIDSNYYKIKQTLHNFLKIKHSEKQAKENAGRL